MNASRNPLVSAEQAWEQHHAEMGHNIVELHRKSGQPLGFQFVSDVRGLGAVVTFVTPGGISSGLLVPGDRIREIEGQDVTNAPHNTILRYLTTTNADVMQLVIEPLPVQHTQALLPPLA
jgi:hypothetical protein